MGLLTDPSAGQGKLTTALLKYHNKLCFFLYVGSIIWFCLLAYKDINQRTYISENALLPGLVRLEFFQESLAKRYYAELNDQMAKYEQSIPYPWLLAKFRQIGLDTYTHNFTLNYPLGKSQQFTGKNVYGILRAARASSTEALILSVPYRPPKSPHPTTAPSIAILLAFAEFANKAKYWAKDIIFLITEHEQLGTQAWLDAYHGVQCGTEGVLISGDMRGRAGAIQAAINLELHDVNIAYIDLKIEGLNGQLPNLDLFNLAAKIGAKEGVYHTFKNREAKSFKDPIKDWTYSFETLMAMVATQASGIPNGNHGLYHRFGIEALTLEGFGTGKKNNWKASFLVIGRILEGIFRSLNNLLERFHQSFFFYLLPSTDRFISIGLYIPSVCAIAAALFIKAYAKWCQLHEGTTTNSETPKQKKTIQKFHSNKTIDLVELRQRYKAQIKLNFESDEEQIDFVRILIIFVVTHCVGIMVMLSPYYLSMYGDTYGFTKEVSVFYGLLGLSGILLVVVPLLTSGSIPETMVVLQIFASLELGTAIVCVAINNFSLGLLSSVILVPCALIIRQTNSRFYAIVQKLFWLILHPMVVLTIIVLVNTYLMFSEEAIKTIFSRGVKATQEAIIYGYLDSMIYGNWLFTVATSIFFSNWLCFWCATFSKVKSNKMNLEKKTN